MRDQIKENVPISQRGHNIKLMAAAFATSSSSRRRCSSCTCTPTSRCARRPRWSRFRDSAQLGLMKEWDVDNLAAAYRFFRLVEHRLQMMHQLQTHTLP